jgi:copper chaperone CopZ
MTHHYEIKGMTCGGCVSKVKSELLKIGEVSEAEVRLAYPQATISMQKHVPVQRLQQALSKAGGYSIQEADAPSLKETDHQAVDSAEEGSYFPILLIFGYITAVTLLIQLTGDGFNTMQWMTHFMAGFFLVFSFFKLMNLKGFAEGYSTYDIIAKRVPVYGFVYPFLELGLGIALLVNYSPLVTNIVVAVVMAVSSIGVIQSLLKKQTFQCACLGTIFKIPLSKVTLFEDLLMVAMSLLMIGYLL